MVVLNTFLLQQETVDKVEQTRNTQANEDLHEFTLTGSQVIYSKIYGPLLSQIMPQNMLIEMFRESTFAVDYTVCISPSLQTWPLRIKRSTTEISLFP